MSSASNPHLVIYEPRAEGHHLPWLRFIADDLLSAGCRLTLALNKEPRNQARIRDHLGPAMDACEVIPAEHPDSESTAQRLAFLQSCLTRSGASSVFLCAYDEIASALARRAFFGQFPPAELCGRMGGVYHRPRFTIAPALSPNRWLKERGFGRLMRKRSVGPLFLLDPDLVQPWQQRYPGAAIHFLPNPCPEEITFDPAAARRDLMLDVKKRVFLFYGIGGRRKGLHLAVEAFLQLPPGTPAVLFCAGALKLEDGSNLKHQLSELENQGRARIVDRYVTSDETNRLFAAADFILLPYVRHFGPSGVLSNAAAAGKPVIVSDYNLLGRLVRRHELGLLFPVGHVNELTRRIREAAGADQNQIELWHLAARKFASLYSRAAFREALVKGVVAPANSAT